MRKPVVSPMQWAAIHHRAPYDQRFSDIAPAFTAIYNATHWEIENLALFNQASYHDVSNRNDGLDRRTAALNQIARSENIDEDEEESFELALARRRESIFAGEMEVEAISRYADEVTVIASWTIVEKQLNRALPALQNMLGHPLTSSHRWPEIEQAFGACGVVLAGLSSYADANECRTLNNAIKHSGVVQGAIAQFPFFQASVGKPIEEIELDTQRYLFAAADFIGASLEASSAVLSSLPGP